MWYANPLNLLSSWIGNVAWWSSWRSISTSTWIFSCIFIYYNYIIKYYINNRMLSSSKIKWVGLNWKKDIAKYSLFGMRNILFSIDRLYILIQILHVRKLKLYKLNKKPILEIDKSILLMRMSHHQLKQISVDYKVSITTNQY